MTSSSRKWPHFGGKPTAVSISNVIGVSDVISSTFLPVYMVNVNILLFKSNNYEVFAKDFLHSVMFCGVSWFDSILVLCNNIKISKDGSDIVFM